MRTTIELSHKHRAKLLEVAARRGDKGFSSVIAEAIDAYLRNTVEDDRLRNKALHLRGKLGREEAKDLLNETARLREHWR